MKPIFFNTEMVRAILDGRKTVTRRIVKLISEWRRVPYPIWKCSDKLLFEKESIGNWWQIWNEKKGRPYAATQEPYSSGDILYVRETWKQATGGTAGDGLCDKYLYKADGKTDAEYEAEGLMVEGRWHPSIYMPKEAARICLQVTNVRAERLQDITEEDVTREGVLAGVSSPLKEFGALWDSILKKGDLLRYGWGANPWIWRIEFETINKEDIR